MAIKSKRTNTTIKLLRLQPTTFGCTPEKPVRLKIPRAQQLDSYIARFSELNNLKSSEFNINGVIITA